MVVVLSVAAVTLGLSVIERHFTLYRTDGGVASSFSLEPAEMAAEVRETKRPWQALGQVSYGSTEAKPSSLQYLSSIYVAVDLTAVLVFTEHNLRIARSGHGAPPQFYEHLLGREARRSYQRGYAANAGSAALNCHTETALLQ